MRKVGLLTISVCLLLLVSFFASYNQEIKTDDQKYYAKYRQHKMKNDGNMPKAERRPSDWFYMQRAYPLESIPAGKQLAGIEAAKELRKTASADKTITYSQWNNVGPENIPGRITDIDGYYTSSSNYDIYAASAAGGVFKSHNGSSNWQSIFDSAGIQSIGAVEVHPSDPNIIYVGTGEANNATDNYEGTGVYKSIDGGATWEYKGLPNSYHISRIVIHPQDYDTVYAAVMGKCWGTNPERGVYRSEDGGDTWSQILYVSDSTGCTDLGLYFDQENAYLIAAMLERIRTPAYRRVGGITSGVYYSEDNGDTWTNMTGTNGFPAASADLGRIGVDMLPGVEFTALIFNNTDGTYNSSHVGFLAPFSGWVTNDTSNALIDLNGSWNGGWYFGNVRASGNLGTVYALGLDMWRRDLHTPWEEISNGMHADQHALWINNMDTDHLFCGNDGGVYSSTNAGDSWSHLNSMANSQFYAIDIDPTRPNNFYGGTQDNGTLKGYALNPHAWSRVLGGDGFYPVVDYIDNDIVYAEYQNGYLMKSTDDAQTFGYAMYGIDYDNDRHNWMTPVVMDPRNHMVLYYGSNFLYKTVDGAANWTKISPDLTNGPHAGNLGLGTITTISVSPIEPDLIYVGTDDGNVWRTNDGGDNWTDITGVLPDRWVTRVAASPHDINVVVLTMSGYKDGLGTSHVSGSNNQGDSWAAIDNSLPDVPVNDIIIDPHESNLLYIATDIGVMYSDNLGGNWFLMSSGMPIVPVMDIDLEPGLHGYERQLAAGTHGRSMYTTFVDCPGTGDSDGDGTNDQCDNCPSFANQWQEDADQDMIGDSCDTCTDTDSDGYGDPGFAANTCPEDNCPDIYNPDQLDLNGDGVGDACNVRSAVWDTIWTDCLGLTVGTNGNYGHDGFGGVNMDYSSSGDCDPTAIYYLFEGSPLLLYNDGDSLVNYYAMYNPDQFILPTDLNFPETTITTPDCDIFYTGTIVTPDSFLAVEQRFWAPKAVDSCPFIIKELKVFSYDGATHTDVSICDIIDWDIPSDVSVNNDGGYDAGENLLYQRGTETDGSGCQPNNNRFGGMSHIETHFYNTDGSEVGLGPHSGAIVDNATYLYPTNGWVPSQINGLIGPSGYTVQASNIDLTSIMNYVYEATIEFDDTITVYTVMSTVENGTSPGAEKSVADLITNIQKGKEWYYDYIAVPEFVCGDVNDNDLVNILDITYLIAYLYKDGPAPVVTESADVNSDSSTNILDITYLIAYLYKGGPAPNCP